MRFRKCYFAPYTPRMANSNLSSFIWSVADLLRGDYKQSEYGKEILPFTVLRRLDCVLEPTKAAVLVEKDVREKTGLNPEPFLLKKSGQFFYNTSPLDLKKLMGDQDHIGENLRAYMQAFSPAFSVDCVRTASRVSDDARGLKRGRDCRTAAARPASRVSDDARGLKRRPAAHDWSHRQLRASAMTRAD